MSYTKTFNYNKQAWANSLTQKQLSYSHSHHLILRQQILAENQSNLFL